MSANALTLNTYFKEKRRIATGLSWTCTGMGPIVMPLIITQLMPLYGMEGTVLIYGGVAFNAVVCSLFFQPVSWHVKKKVQIDPESEKLEEKDQKPEDSDDATEKLLNGQHSKSLENIIRTRKMSLSEPLSAKEVFGSQYLYYDDEEHGAYGIDVMGPGTPMISLANDGWSAKLNASNASLASNRTSKRENSIRSRRGSLSLSGQNSAIGLSSSANRVTNETENKKKKPSNAMEISLDALNETNETGDGDHVRINNVEPELNNSLAVAEESSTNVHEPRKTKNLKYWLKRIGHSIVIFFDLDLLRDPIYVNLMLGITFANFTELNFALLTPFILGEYGFTKLQVATFMSILGGVDVFTRIIIPFIATFIGWENRSFFLLGVSGLAVGRIALGMGIAMSSFLIALNSYFLEKRGRAMGIAMTLTGIGPILIPQLIRFLLDVYEAQGTMLILGGCSLHALIGALLLHPVKWHARKEIINLKKGEILETQSAALLQEICPDCTKDTEKSDLNSNSQKESVYELQAMDLVSTINLGSSFNVFDESKSSDDEKEIPLDDLSKLNGINHIEEMICQKCGTFFLPEKTYSKNQELKVGKKKTRLQKISYLFGFDLLRDVIFVNITLGMSLAIFAETNFSTLTPFILKDMKLNTNNIAIVMSLLGTMDLLLRGISPFIGDRLRKSPRTMYLFSLVLLIIGRTLLMFTSSFISLLFVIIWLGIAKGIRAVYSTLVIPNYVPLERLPSASSLQQIVVGFLSLGAGPIIGFIRDATGSYVLGIAFINCMSGLTILMWMAEMFFVSRKRKSQPNR
ncbi:uncharacterized protein LOC117172579 isoform X2 [Belonocnema kinseyi]|nr:uncharacterized protein LOC117172579 isoform X2 [Belonocnema kinseyi]XP_033216544.1 uncharacterized protein LOC117172579 isoform X2 [Belonocnema kinseyi]XP_033216545.1 uncharacterized protein LOC117172579 isoform X2 [Belonocnema kinseyi]